MTNIVLETDSPYLTPEPFRGQKNEPFNVFYVAKKIAEIKGISLEEVIQVTTSNSISQFDSPNFQLVKEIVSKLPVPVIAEGRIHTPEDAVKMLEEGALCIVVGGAITRPMEITERFVHAINQSRLRSMR